MEANQRFFPASLESFHFRSRGQFCSHPWSSVHTVPDKSYQLYCDQQWQRSGTSRPQTSNVVPERLAEGDLVNKISVLTPKYLLPSQWIPVLPAPTYSLPLRSLIPVHITPKAWHRTYPICTAPISRSARRSFALSWKSRQNRCSHVWTEGLSGLVFAQVQRDLFGKIWT